jgi:hypothetical protein
MEENLVGYLLKSLDDATHQQVEASLEMSPELRSRLRLLERALAPLSADAGRRPAAGAAARSGPLDPCPHRRAGVSQTPRRSAAATPSIAVGGPTFAAPT